LTRLPCDKRNFEGRVRLSESGIFGKVAFEETKIT